MRNFFFPLILLICLSTTACTYILNNLPGVYKVDIQQGNFIDQAMIDQLRPNMSKRQVLFIMGSPMVSSPFNDDHWEYLYSFQPGGDDRTQRSVALVFKNDHLVGVQGDIRPTALPVVKPSDQTTVELPKRNLDRTLWEKISSLFTVDTPPTAAEETSKKTKPDADDGQLAPP